jgi:mono/diheme cytochrome c family protein
MTPTTHPISAKIIMFAAALFAVVMAACGASETPTPTPAPPTPTPEPTARPEVIGIGKAAFIRIGCVACHAIKGLSDQAQAAPALDEAYKLAVDVLKSPEYKKSGGKAKTPREFFSESILDPNAFVYPKCPQGPCIKGTMPQNYKDILRPEELNGIIEYLMSLGR